MAIKQVSPATPKEHKNHGEYPCGCWTGEGPSVSCDLCGASYRQDEVAGFNFWRCYDCGAGWFVRPMSRYEDWQEN